MLLIISIGMVCRKKENNYNLYVIDDKKFYIEMI